MLPQIKTPLPGPKARAVIERDESILSPSYTRSYPFVMDHGEGCIVNDPDGNSFLDFAAGIAVCSTGHHHPHVTQAIKDQVDRFIHMSGTDFYYNTQLILAERLAEAAPISGPKRVFFTNSGAEAIEAAFKLARYHTKRTQNVAFFGSFHGRTMGALSLTASKTVQKKGFAPFIPGISHVHYGHCYRCPHNLKYPSCGIFCAEYLEKVLFKHSVDPEDVAAIFVEPVQGEGGYVPPPQEFMTILAKTCKKHGIMLVVDEVQSGMGRTGKMFGIEHYGIEPDIICVAKGIASGLPLGAIITKRDVMNWKPGSHASTFGGNPVSCAAGIATMDLLLGHVDGVPNGGLIENARVVGEYLKNHLIEMKARYPFIGDIRGLGLMLGAEVNEPGSASTPAPELRNQILMDCFSQGLLILGCGANSLRFAPPLILSKEQADWAVDCLDKIFAKVGK